MAYWLFQGNPKYYRLDDAIADFTEMYWPMRRYGQFVAPGDGVLIWRAGAAAGVVAIAEILTAAATRSEELDRAYWLDRTKVKAETPKVRIRFTRKLGDRPLLKTICKGDPLLKDLPVIRQPNNTNYKLSPEQWQRVFELLQRNPSESN
ncbi:MAG: EVE domain-containing protein [Cyanobacteria bacterium]|nr:EVE domain-containing protein [Cyanobacteriota bacterium]